MRRPDKGVPSRFHTDTENLSVSGKFGKPDAKEQMNVTNGANSLIAGRKTSLLFAEKYCLFWFFIVKVTDFCLIYIVKSYAPNAACSRRTII